MSNCLEKKNICRDRPYGGVGFLWRKSLCKEIRLIGNDNSCRCLAIAFGLCSKEVLNVVSIYLPCIEASVQYSVDIG
jgi:hypothetical protein